MTDIASVRRQLYFLHRWVGIGFATLGIVVFYSGALVVFNEEIDDWAHRADHTPNAAEVKDFSYDDAYRKASAGIDAGLKDRIFVRQHPGDPVAFTFVSTDAKNTTTKIAHVDPRSGAVVARDTIHKGERAAMPRASSLTRFYLDLHLFVLMPRTLGLIITGLAGFALMVLVTTGTWVYRPTRRKMSSAPTGSVRRFVGQLHSLVGAWTLPFTSLLAVTGTFFSFAGAVLLPVIAFVSFGGDQEKLVESVIGTVQVEAAPGVASLDEIMRDAQTRSGGHHQGVILNDWEGDNAHAIANMVIPQGLTESRIKLVYDGHTGAFLEQRESIGKTPSLGGWLLWLIGHLHFGTLFGVYTKVLWTLCGVATSLLGVSGLLVFVLRQNQSDWATRAVCSLATVLSTGLPLLVAATATAWCLCWTFEIDRPAPVLTATFALGLLALLALGSIVPLRSAVTATAATGGLLWLALPFVAMTTQQLSWSSVVGHPTAMVDVLCWVGGLAFLGLSAFLLRGPPQRVSAHDASDIQREMLTDAA